MDFIVEHFVMTICAPRRSGKSYLMKHMLKNGLLKIYDKVKILSPSAKFNNDYDEFENCSNVEIITNPSSAYISNLIHEHEVCAERVKNDENVECPWTLLVLDDLIDSNIFVIIKLRNYSFLLFLL